MRWERGWSKQLYILFIVKSRKLTERDFNKAYRKSETQDPKVGPGTQDLQVRPYVGTLR